MARTRGGGNSQAGRDEDRTERRHPIASARRQRVGVSIDEEAHVQAPQTVVEEAIAQPQVEAAAEPQVEAAADDGESGVDRSEERRVVVDRWCD